MCTWRVNLSETTAFKSENEQNLLRLFKQDILPECNEIVMKKISLRGDFFCDENRKIRKYVRGEYDSINGNRNVFRKDTFW